MFNVDDATGSIIDDTEREVGKADSNGGIACPVENSVLPGSDSSCCMEITAVRKALA